MVISRPEPLVNSSVLLTWVYRKDVGSNIHSTAYSGPQVRKPDETKKHLLRDPSMRAASPQIPEKGREVQRESSLKNSFNPHCYQTSTAQLQQPPTSSPKNKMQSPLNHLPDCLPPSSDPSHSLSWPCTFWKQCL